MTAIGEWLRQLVLIVVLAVFADLLLPTKAMQKYVRVVMGLAIMAAMLQPIVPFFKRDWADQMAQAITKEVDNNQAAPNQLVDVQQIRSQLQSQKYEQAEKFISEQLQRGIRGKFHDAVSRITVSGVDGGPSSIRVEVVLPTFSRGDGQAVATWVASTLGISATQVNVTTGGG